MTFRIDDLTVAVLPQRYSVDAGECTKCTKCTLRTGGPSGCEDTVSTPGNCCNGRGNSDASKTKRKNEHDADTLALLLAQLDEVLVSAR